MKWNGNFGTGESGALTLIKTPNLTLCLALESRNLIRNELKIFSYARFSFLTYRINLGKLRE